MRGGKTLSVLERSTSAPLAGASERGALIFPLNFHRHHWELDFGLSEVVEYSLKYDRRTGNQNSQI